MDSAYVTALAIAVAPIIWFVLRVTARCVYVTGLWLSANLLRRQSPRRWKECFRDVRQTLDKR
jgi:hypothetical protein